MADQKPINFAVPSPETLAGIDVLVEEEEDLTIRPGQIQPIHPENGATDDAASPRTSSQGDDPSRD